MKKNLSIIPAGILFFFFTFGLLLLLCGCSTAPVTRTALDASVSSTRAAIVHVQASAAAIRSRDPATSAAISDLRNQLAGLGVQFDAMTGKVQWYEADWTRLTGENGSLKNDNATLKRDLHTTAKERDFYPWLIAFVLGWAFLRAVTPTLVAGFRVIPYIGPLLVLAAPEIAFAMGAALGFAGARILASYGSRLLP